MKKLRKNFQYSLINPKRAGRPAIHDKGVRHSERLKFYQRKSLHLTIKVRENKADIQLIKRRIELERILDRSKDKFINFLNS